VAADGIYRAQVHFDDGQQGEGGDVSLALGCVDEKKVALLPDAAGSGRDIESKVLPTYSAGGNLERVETNQQQ
jgi:orotate phosphoribosyltransferase-like protein